MRLRGTTEHENRVQPGGARKRVSLWYNQPRSAIAWRSVIPVRTSIPLLRLTRAGKGTTFCRTQQNWEGRYDSVCKSSRRTRRDRETSALRFRLRSPLQSGSSSSATGSWGCDSSGRRSPLEFSLVLLRPAVYRPTPWASIERQYHAERTEDCAPPLFLRYPPTPHTPIPRQGLRLGDKSSSFPIVPMDYVEPPDDLRPLGSPDGLNRIPTP